MIPEEALEAAVKADTLAQFDTRTDRIQAVLEAAAPFLDDSCCCGTCGL